MAVKAFSIQSPPLHQRVYFLKILRSILRNGLLQVFTKLMTTEESKKTLATVLTGAVQPVPGINWPDFAEVELPYADLGKSPKAVQTAQRDDIVIITARFRTGSTLLWNLFRHLPGCTAYYEPLNERRWFDPLTRGTTVDQTHQHVDTYWQEYTGVTEAGHYYREHWIDRHLLMDSYSWEPDLKRYIECLIEGAAGRPVLQFNRIDFRLPWFRHHFPNAKIVHLYRHPRDQWCSTLLRDSFPLHGTMAEFAAYDHFYLSRWVQDLQYQFPFLRGQSTAHPYQLFYYLWKLSYLFGTTYAHYSLAFEDLVSYPQITLETLFTMLGIDFSNIATLQGLIEQQTIGKWQQYASADWFQRHEAVCETVLQEFLSTVNPEPGECPTDRNVMQA